MAETTQIRFVVTLPNTRNRPYRIAISQAESAEVRSHAARVAHSRKRAKDISHFKGHRNARTAGRHGRSSQEAAAAPPRLKSECSESSPDASPDPCLTVKFITTSQLDPFVRLSLNVDSEDRNLIHKYLTQTPRLYGTTPESPFCPVRDTTGSGIAHNTVWLIEALAVVAGSQSYNSNKDQRILAKKAARYQLLSKYMSSQSQRVSEEAIIALLVVGHSEMRHKTRSLANPHWEAATNLIRFRGRERGFKAIQDFRYPEVQLLVKLYVCIGVRNVFDTQAFFNQKANALAAKLDLMQDWNRHLRSEHGNSSWRIDDKRGTGQSQTMTNAKKSWRLYFYVRDSVFGRGSWIRRYVENAPRKLSGVEEWGSEERCHISVLYALNCILFAQRDEPEEASAFLAELDHILKATRRTNTFPELLGMMWVFTLAYCAQKLGLWKASDQCPYRLWEIIEFVDIVLSSTLPSQEKVRKVLASWLVCEMDDAAGLVDWEEDDRDTFVSEACGGWFFTTRFA